MNTTYLYYSWKVSKRQYQLKSTQNRTNYGNTNYKINTMTPILKTTLSGIRAGSFHGCKGVRTADLNI
ncbi:hypothetical protein Hanom_Chr01g00070881 [Helianthus anomalus]